MMAITWAMKRRPKHARDELREDLRNIAFKKGAVAFGVASADDADALPRVKIGWIVNASTVPVRKTMPEAQSVIVFGILSRDDADELEVDRGKKNFSYPGFLPISVIARDLVQDLRARGFRACLPSVYMSDKRLAILAGIGNYGKNSLIVSPRHGPWLRLGSVLTDAYLEPSGPARRDPCGDCSRCVRACPAKALKPFVVDPWKCLVGASSLPRVPAKTRKMLERYAPMITPNARVMCRTCQLVCPYTSAERRKNTIEALKRSSRKS